ncbi:beta-2-microglobulin-like [Betta splendens]|uniref:Beta-2-microglobulin n=1 Tax=Betta splendens TaxID=158456 RepID=A0A6P7NBH8_BETSP|nr:beta-2-microglobulin-like [Betta splendens]
MKPLVCCFFYLLVLSHSMAKKHSPKVQVYSRNPEELGKPNVIICHVSGFYPPQIKIDILKNDAVIPTTNQTDLAFDDNWQYYLTKHTRFTPSAKDKYACRVTHLEQPKTYVWEPDM